MGTFDSWDAYDRFAAVVRKERRFAHSKQCIQFLEAVIATSTARINTLRQGHPLCRAQIGHGWEVESPEEGVEYEVPCPFPPGRMIPDPSMVPEGRLNPRGMAYLYLADLVETAVAEVRPWVGASVSVGFFEMLQDLRVVDCSVGHRSPHLFLKAPPEEEWDKIVWEGIDKAFSRPTDPGDSHFAYAPTQILAEVFRDQGYDGVAYKSALVDEGLNFALFDPSSVHLFACQLRNVASVRYTHSESARPYSRERKTQTPVAKEGAEA